MIDVVKNSYALFFKKFPHWLVFVLPMIVFSCLDDIWGVGSEFNYTLKIVGLVIFALTEMAIYRYVLEMKLGGFWKSLYKMLFLVVFQVIAGFIMLAPVYVFVQIAQHHQILSFAYILLSFIINIFLGGWIFARANVIIPLILAGEKLTIARCKEYGQGSYQAWALVSFLIYFPYVAGFYLISNIFVNNILTSLYVVIFCLFNALFYKEKSNNN